MTSTPDRTPDRTPVDRTFEDGPGGGLAFFDVDETLVAVKSMVSVYRFLADRQDGAERRRRLVALDELLSAGLPREEANRCYYRLLSGWSVEEVRTAAREWFAEQVRAGAVIDSTARRLAAHRRRGDMVALVSGSFPACLEPVADHFGATVVLCSRPEVVEGVYTGELAEPMIGAGKARAVAALLVDVEISGPTWGYGDHASDLPMLELADHPVVVAAAVRDPLLAAVARERGWPVLQACDAAPQSTRVGPR